MLEHRYQLEDTLKLMAQHGQHQFYVDHVCAYSGIEDKKFVIEYLFEQVDDRKLKRYYKVRCPADGVDFEFSIPSHKSITLQEMTCHVCGMKYTPSPDRTFICFEFTPQYVSHILRRRRLS